MSPRTRNHENKDLARIPNLYRKVDKRTGRENWQYKDPRNGKFWGLGADEEVAKDRARQLNAAIYSQIVAKQDNILSQPVTSGGIKFKAWVAEYIAMADRALESGKIKPNTHRTRVYICTLLAEAFAGSNLRGVTVKDVAQHLKAYRDRGKERMAQSVRSTLIDIFAEAIQAGECDSNPAAMTKTGSATVQRSRLTLEEWQAIYEAAGTLQPWTQNALAMALLTGQRLEDIALARFKKSADWEPAFVAYRQRKPHAIKPYAYVEGDHLHVPQQKTGTLLRIPLELRLDCIGLSIGDVVARCRKRALSKYLIHHTKRGTNQEIGDPVHLNTVSKGFMKARVKSGMTWEGKTPPTFHEQRSLAERLYREQGIDTQRLLGHKSQKMTDVYHDVRGSEWLDVLVK